MVWVKVIEKVRTADPPESGKWSWLSSGAGMSIRTMDPVIMALPLHLVSTGWKAAGGQRPSSVAVHATDQRIDEKG